MHIVIIMTMIATQWRKINDRAKKLADLGAQGSLKISCTSLKFLQGAQRSTGFYTQHHTLKLLSKMQLGSLGRKALISSPGMSLMTNRLMGIWGMPM